jgi:hypothetical protein
MVCVEGFRLKVERVSKKQLVSVWKKLTDKPYPKIKALILTDEDFDHVMEHRRCLEDQLREIEEWGRILPTKGTDACIFNAEDTADADYVILIRQNAYHTLDEIIEHELTHLARGDL